MPNIRIREDDKSRLDRICKETSMSQTEVVHKAISLLEKEQLSNQLQNEFAALASDKSALAAYRREAISFDQSSADGLDE